MVQTLNEAPRLQIDGACASLWLQRPGLANRLSPEDIAVLHRHIETLGRSSEVRLVLLRGLGAHFCAGFQIDAADQVDAPALFEALSDAWEALPQLTVALVQGGVWGGAVDLALACDFRLGGPAARLGIPAARLGLHFYGGGMRRLVSRLGLGAAKRLLLAGRSWDASQMVAGGFFDELDDDLELLAARWQTELLSLAPLAQAGMKKHLNAIAVGALDTQALALDQALCAGSRDFAEGLKAWAARRAPQFAGA
jgi:enoyl-CoA hydratase